MTAPFEKAFLVRWGDMDFNAHLRNTAYLDLSADTRMLFFESQGFSMREFERLRLGPVVLKDEMTYHKELRLLETVRVTLELAALADDGSRFRLRNTFYRPEGPLAATVTSSGAWMDLAARKLTLPPEGLVAALGQLARTEDFETLAPR